MRIIANQTNGSLYETECSPLFWVLSSVQSQGYINALLGVIHTIWSSAHASSCGWTHRKTGCNYMYFASPTEKLAPGIKETSQKRHAGTWAFIDTCNGLHAYLLISMNQSTSLLGTRSDQMTIIVVWPYRRLAGIGGHRIDGGLCSEGRTNAWMCYSYYIVILE